MNWPNSVHAFQLTHDHLRRLHRQVTQHIGNRIQSIHPDMVAHDPIEAHDHRAHLGLQDRVLWQCSLDGVGYEISIARILIQRIAHICLGGTHPEGIGGCYGIAETATESLFIEWACEVMKHQGLVLRWERMDPSASQMEGGRVTHMGFGWRHHTLGEWAIRLPRIDWKP